MRAFNLPVAGWRLRLTSFHRFCGKELLVQVTHWIVALVIMGPARVDAAESADAVVYGATPAGIAAAVAAAGAGHEVLLVEPTHRIGGMLTCGLSYSDFRTFESLSGFFLSFSKRVESDYRHRYGNDSQQVRDCWRGTYGEPSVNLRILELMIAEHAKIRLLKQHRLASIETTPIKQGRRRIGAVTLTKGVSGENAAIRVAAEIFIDASYEGDLMAMAGENYHVGRESRWQYGEPLAGDANGYADGQVQGYNFRLCMTQVDANKRMPVAPEGYRGDDFVGVLSHFVSGRLKRVFDAGHDGIFRAHMPLMPNGKADVNDAPGAPVRLSMPDINDGWPEGDALERHRIFVEHLQYHVGLLYFLQNDPRVPQGVRSEARSWGWCQDEFRETDGLPPQLYVREGRRLVGQKVFTGNETLTAPNDARARLHRDSIATADYIHNCHGTGRRGSRFDGEHEGQFFHFVQPYQIPYGVIVPQISENLLVPVACSASHFGFGALRLEPVWTSLGQAAGWAAHLALSAPAKVQDVSVTELQKLLHADGSATVYVSDVPPESPDFAAVQWWGTLGGFHGLVSRDEPEKPVKIIGQYYQPFADHAAGLGEVLTPKLRLQWERLLSSKATASADPLTRGEWIRHAYDADRRAGVSQP